MLPGKIVRSCETRDTIKPVTQDGQWMMHHPCILEKLLYIGCKVTFDDLTTCLQNELQSDKYQTFKTDDTK